MNLETRLFNGDRAREVLENEQYIAAFEAIEQDLIESWRNTPSTKANSEPRERLHLSLTLLGKLQATLKQTLDTGKLAKLELEHKRNLAQRGKDAWSAFSSE